MIDANFIRGIQEKMFKDKKADVERQVEFILEIIQKQIVNGYNETCIGFKLDDNKCSTQAITDELKKRGFTAYYSFWTKKLYVAW